MLKISIRYLYVYAFAFKRKIISYNAMKII